MLSEINKMIVKNMGLTAIKVTAIQNLCFKKGVFTEDELTQQELSLLNTSASELKEVISEKDIKE